MYGRKPNPTLFERKSGELQRILRVKQSLEPYPYRPPFSASECVKLPRFAPLDTDVIRFGVFSDDL